MRLGCLSPGHLPLPPSGHRPPRAKARHLHLRTAAPTIPIHPYKVHLTQAREGTHHTHTRAHTHTHFLESSWLARVELSVLTEEEKLEVLLIVLKWFVFLRSDPVQKRPPATEEVREVLFPLRAFQSCDCVILTLVSNPSLESLL